MIFDELGLPKEMGASDLQDSARLAGIMQVFGWDLPLDHYLMRKPGEKSYYVRHPKEIKYDFSRDQAVCLMAGYHFAGLPQFVDKSCVTGKDFFSPSVMGHVARCEGKKATWFQNLWLKIDILWNAFFAPLSESNQLICMLMVAGPEYLKLWTDMNDEWETSIRNYWYGWRGEPELANKMIDTIKRLTR